MAAFHYAGRARGLRAPRGTDPGSLPRLISFFGMRPILAIDVNGVLVPDVVMPGKPPDGWRDTWTVPGGYPVRYCPDHGIKLQAVARATGAELVWCTMWEDEANTDLAPLVGLPPLPVVPMGPGKMGLRFSIPGVTVGMGKARRMAAWAGARPFCWLEDEPDAAQELARHPVPHLVIGVDPLEGLQDRHLIRAAAWLSALAGAA